MQPYPRAPDLVWPGHLHGTGCLSARAVGTGFPTVGLRLWLGPGCGWSWVLFTPARFGWGLGWVCLGSVFGVAPLLSAVCGVRGWALVSACFRDLCGFVRFSLAPRPFRFRCVVWACVLGPGFGCAPPFLAGLSGCVFCAFFFFFPVAGCPCPGPCGLFPRLLSFGLGCWLFFFFFFCLFRCPFFRWAAVFGLVLPVLAGWSPCACLGVLSSVPSGWGGFGPLLCCWRAVWWLWRVFARPCPPPLFFFFWGGGGGAHLAVPPFAFPRLAFALWLVCGVVGPSPLLAEVPVCYSPPLLAGFRCRWWWAVPATPGWGLPAAVVCGVWRWCVGGVVAGVWCGWSLATPGGGSCVLLPATPGSVSLPLVVGGPRHSWLGSACGGGVWCVVCGVWCVGGVVAGVWCGWSLATPGGGSCVLLPATPGSVSLPVVVGGPRHSWLGSACGGGVWCVVCGVWRWCVGGVVAGVWCGWSLATPGGGSCVLLPATPGWVSLPVVVGGPRHSWLGSACGGGVWCVVCGGGVSVGLRLVCGVVGPSPLLAEVPVCYSPPLLAGFRCRWWWAVPATPGWGPLAASVCGVWRWCVGGVVAGVWCGWSLATPGGGPCVLLPATPGWVSLPVVVGGPRHSWLGSVGGGGVWCVVCCWGPSPLLAEVPVCYSPPLLAGFRCRWWWAVPATPGWGPLAAVVCVLCLAGSDGPASRARSGAPHLFLWPLCVSALLGPLRAGVAPLSFAAVAVPRWLGFVVCGLAVAWHLFVCRGSLRVVRALRVCGTRRPSLLGTCPCALVVAGGVPLWRASWPRVVRRASSGPVALGAPVGFPDAVMPFPTPGACAPGFTGRLRGARGGRPRTGLIVPAAGPRRGRGAGLAPRRTRSGPRDGVVPGGSLRRRSWAACAAVVGVCGPGH